MTDDEQRIVDWLTKTAENERAAFAGANNQANAILILHSSGVKDLVASSIEQGLHRQS